MSIHVRASMYVIILLTIHVHVIFIPKYATLLYLIWLKSQTVKLYLVVQGVK